MNRHTRKSRFRHGQPSISRQSRKPLRPSFEPLEERCLLDSSPPAIVVGRTLSSYTIGGIANNQEIWWPA
jgi:hypothetical protein